jgi:hypothetical protein
MQVHEVQSIIHKNKQHIAFVIGNGLNRNFKGDNLTWNELLLNLWKQFSKHKQSNIPLGISTTEFYDALDINNANQNKFSVHLQLEVQKQIKKLKPSNNQNIVLSKIKQLKAPILTTNFDDLMAQSMGLTFYKIDSTKFTDYYPWSCYYAEHKLSNPLKGFGIWHPHGMVKYHRSIKLGLSEYMGNVARARKILQHQNAQAYYKTNSLWEGDQTWLTVFLNKALFIFGFGLDENEVFFRWLLIERAKYYKRFPKKKQPAWYMVLKQSEESKNEGKRFFLQSVGVEMIELNSYKEMYEMIWE